MWKCPGDVLDPQNCSLSCFSSSIATLSYLVLLGVFESMSPFTQFTVSKVWPTHYLGNFAKQGVIQSETPQSVHFILERLLF